MTITHISEREQALQRENERYLKTINIQAVTIEAQQEEIAEYRKKYNDTYTALDDCARELAQDTAMRLCAERNAFKADAARYQWLRSRIPGSDYRIMGIIYSDGGAGVDAAIDAAMKETK